MASAIKVPSRAALRGVLAGLLGDVSVSDVKPPPEAVSDCVAVYVDDENALAAVCILGFDLAVAAGAAIALVPAAVAQEARDTGTISSSLRENLREVMNVVATLLCSEETPHVKFTSLHFARAEASPESLALAAKPAGRLDVGVSLGDYDGGTLSILTR